MKRRRFGRAFRSSPGILAALRRRVPRFGSLRQRITVLFASLFAGVLALVVILAGQGLSHFAEASAARDLAANARVFDEILRLQSRQMRDQTDVLARDFGFREAVATADQATIASALASLKLRAGSDAAFVLTLDGELIAAAGSDPLDPVRLWSRLDAGMTNGIIKLGKHHALAAASPIEAPDVMGWLVIAQRLDGGELDRLVELAAISLKASVLDQAQQSPGLRSAVPGKVFEIAGQQRSLVLITGLPTLQDGITPQLVLRHNLAESLVGYARLEWLLAGLALGGMAVVLWLSARVARSVTSPLNQLDAAAQLIGEGRHVNLRLETGDEIERLAESFNQMVTAIDERERQIIHVGLHDGLTDLPNRKLFTQNLDNVLARRRSDEQVLVAYVDLDDFKLINDTLGHPAGDALLRGLAEHLRADLPDAVIARIGGDEFAILIDAIKSDTSLGSLAEKLSHSFKQVIDFNGQQMQCSASLGMAVAPGDGSDGTTLMKNADLALYRAKSDGKAKYHFFEPALDELARQRRQLEIDLRLAIKEGGFELFFQPLYAVAERRVAGFEALIRWNHPEHGQISPADFIPLAEETGLIVPLGEWVIREACRIAAQWPADVGVAVNVSPKQFTCAGLAATVMQALAVTGLEPHRLELEITESIFIADTERTLVTLHALRNLGVRIALDDFGTGYSSLSYLRSFPFNKLKIDRSFVRDLGTEGNAHAVIRAITALADALGMETLAEGVEEVAQFDILHREGCQYIQGFLFSRPVSAAKVPALLDDSIGYQRLIGAAA